MNTQNVTIEVNPATAAILQRLEQKAQAQGVSLEALLLSLAELQNESSREEPDDETEPAISLHPNQRWMRAYREAYRGQWIVLYQGRLIAHGDDGEAVIKDARAQGIAEPFLAFIPLEDLPFAGF